MPRTTEQFKIEVETCTKGTVYIEAPDEATARLMVENATLEQAMHNQVLHEAIKEKVSFKPISAVKMTCGIDYIPGDCPRDCPDCPLPEIQAEINQT
jgi:hypothetical protein